MEPARQPHQQNTETLPFVCFERMCATQFRICAHTACTERQLNVGIVSVAKDLMGTVII